MTFSVELGSTLTFLQPMKWATLGGLHQWSISWSRLDLVGFNNDPTIQAIANGKGPREYVKTFLRFTCLDCARMIIQLNKVWSIYAGISFDPFPCEFLGVPTANVCNFRFFIGVKKSTPELWIWSVIKEAKLASPFWWSISKSSRTHCDATLPEDMFTRLLFQDKRLLQARNTANVLMTSYSSRDNLLGPKSLCFRSFLLELMLSLQAWAISARPWIVKIHL